MTPLLQWHDVYTRLCFLMKHDLSEKQSKDDLSVLCVGKSLKSIS